MQNSFFGTSQSSPPAIQGFAPFALGFRPFFICAGVGAIVLLGLWLAIWSNALPPNSYYGTIIWHSHEMLFGYTAAVISGFLLTAVRNWTGIDTLTGQPLAALAGLWLAGRILPLLPGVPGALIAVVDLAFLPLITLALSGPLLKSDYKLNRVFIPLLGIMAAANLLVHLQALGLTEATAVQGTGLMRNLILALILIIAGRVMPFFTRSALPGTVPETHAWLENLAGGVFFLYLVSELFMPYPWLMGILAALLVVTQAIRVVSWYDRRIWSIPILWVLYTGYGWIILGFALQALSALGWVASNLALHALTVGGIGTLTLGMMARVSLGHTGRPMLTAKAINLAFVLLNLAAAIRVLVPIALPQWYSTWVQLSGGIWLVGFALFCIVYLPILIRPRLDGRPG